MHMSARFVRVGELILLELARAKVIVEAFSIPTKALPVLFVELKLSIFFEVSVALVILVSVRASLGAITELAHALPAKMESAFGTRHVWPQK